MAYMQTAAESSLSLVTSPRFGLCPKQLNNAVHVHETKSNIHQTTRTLFVPPPALKTVPEAYCDRVCPSVSE